jgi:hypothetical protein
MHLRILLPRRDTLGAMPCAQAPIEVLNLLLGPGGRVLLRAIANRSRLARHYSAWLACWLSHGVIIHRQENSRLKNDPYP